MRRLPAWSWKCAIAIKISPCVARRLLPRPVQLYRSSSTARQNWIAVGKIDFQAASGARIIHTAGQNFLIICPFRRQPQGKTKTAALFNPARFVTLPR
nr:MAG TPA: hypothetical protein [Bacteriophage sp.]